MKQKSDIVSVIFILNSLQVKSAYMLSPIYLFMIYFKENQRLFISNFAFKKENKLKMKTLEKAVPFLDKNRSKILISHFACERISYD